MEGMSSSTVSHNKNVCEKVETPREVGFDMISSSDKAIPAEIAFEARWAEY